MRAVLCLLSIVAVACLGCSPEEPVKTDEPVAQTPDPVTQTPDTATQELVPATKEPGPVISEARIEKDEYGFAGHLYVTVGDEEMELDEEAVSFWIAEDRETIYWSYPHRKSGYEAEGQGLKRQNAGSGETEIVFEDDAYIDSVTEATSKSGRTALIVIMSDSGLGATTVVIADPDRGRVFREPFGKLVRSSGGTVSIGTFEGLSAEDVVNNDLDPTSEQVYDLDELLDKEADRDIINPWPPYG